MASGSQMYRPPGARRNRSLEPKLPRSARQGKSNQSNAESQPNFSSLDDEYLGALGEAVREVDARREQGRDGLWCICRRKENVAGSIDMYECEDPGCHIKWYHDICVSSWEKEMIAKDPHWICKLCFDRRQASRYATLRRSDGEKLDQPTSPAANGEGKGKEAAQRQPEAPAQGSGTRKIPSTEPVQATSGRKQPEPTNASRERPDQWKLLQEIISQRARRQPWTMHDQYQEMRRVDAYLQETDQWFYPGPDPPKNEQNATFENTETGERRILPMVGAGHQVTHTSATDFKERKRVSLEIGRNDFPVFQYHHGEIVHYTELEGPIIVLVCEPHGTNQAEVEVPARLLAKFSEPIALVAALDSWDPPANQVIGRLTLPGIDATLAKQVASYLKGESFEVSAMVRSGDKTSKRNVVRAVQASSMAHILGINELQRGAMHTLLHFLIIYKQVLSGDELRLELGRLFPGCPAQLILHACLHHGEGEEPELSPSEAPGVAGLSKGLSNAKSLLAAALHPDSKWDWKALKMSTWKSMSKNRGLEELWNESEPFLASRKTFTQARAKFTDADPFWRLGGARGAVLGSHFPSWWPRLSAKDLEREKERWQAALPPIKARSKRKNAPPIVVTPPTPEIAKTPAAVESLPKHQPNVEVERTSDAPYVKDQKASKAEDPGQDDESESLRPLPKSVVEEDDLVEISEAEWRLHQSSQQNISVPR